MNTVSLNVDGRSFDSPVGSVSGDQMFNNASSDPTGSTDFLAIFKTGLDLPADWTLGAGSQEKAGIAFFNAAGTALPDGSLPTSFYINDWDEGNVLISISQDISIPSGTVNNVYVEGTTIAVPEPVSAILVPLVPGFTVFYRHRRVRNARTAGRTSDP